APGVRAGKKIVVTGPTCSYQLKREVPELLDTDDARAVGEATLDVFEFLWTLRGAGTLKKDFQRPLGKVAYHLPCHLKSQNIGFRSMQFLKGAGADVEMLDACSGVDGTWGMKKRFYDASLEIARPLLEAVKEARPDRVATDCPLSALRILEGTGREPVHPIVLLAEAYGLSVDA
ncbi:MAG: heterodisulfide reductase-related iron-sulfur binding cluster, partial [Planctomycetota bacterium JB042]